MRARFPSLALTRPGSVKYYSFLNKVMEAIGDYPRKSVEQARAVYRAHQMLLKIHGRRRWDLQKSAEELGISPVTFATLYATGQTLCEPKKEVRDMKKKPPRYADLHHVHFLCPRPLWIKFIRLFPSKGDITRGMIEAMELYIGTVKQAREAELDAMERGNAVESAAN